MNVRLPACESKRSGGVLGEARFCLVLDHELTLVSCDQRFANWLGYDDPQELRGRPLLETLDPSSDPKLEILAERLTSRVPLLVELVHRRRDGRPALASYHLFPDGLLGPGQDHLVALGSDQQVGMDLLEEVIGLKREQEAVLARTRELAARLQVRNADLAAISHMIRHDVNNSLNGITLASALNDATEETNERQHHSAQIRHLCRHIAGQLNGFVALADAISLADVGRTCDLGLMATGILDMVIDRYPGVSHHIQWQLDAPTAWIAPDHLGQILENLLDNAFKYREPSRPLLELSLASRRVGDRVELEITDNGRGIPEDLQTTIFDLFLRGVPEVANGSGIGLAIVKRLAEANDGRVTLESRPGGGTTFRLNLHASAPTV